MERDKIGFFDDDAAQRHARAKRRWQEAEKSALSQLRPALPAGPARLTWRDLPRACIPGALIRRAVAWITDPLVLAGPEICRQLERHIERPVDSRGRAHPAVLLRSVAIWLTETPNDARRAIPERTSGEASSPAMPDPSQGSGQGSSRCEARE